MFRENLFRHWTRTLEWIQVGGGVVSQLTIAEPEVSHVLGGVHPLLSSALSLLAMRPLVIRIRAFLVDNYSDEGALLGVR